MLFNADRNVKDNLFQMYKRDAMDQVNKKSEMRIRKLNEERDYMDTVNRREQLEDDRRKLEKLRRVNETMSDYKEMLSHQDVRIRKNKFDDVKINTYGVNFRGDSNNKVNQNLNMQMNNQNLISSKSNDNILNNNQNYNQQERNLDQRVTVSPKTNHVKSLVSYQNNENNYENDDYTSRVNKMEQQKLYKDFLDNQMILRGPRIKNYGNNSYSLNNPYNNKNYEFGTSHLDHNPITNPVNNLQYNKYLSNNIPNKNYNQIQMNPNDNLNRNPYQNPKDFNQNLNTDNNYNPYQNDYNYYQQNPYMNKEPTPQNGERLRMAANNILR